MIVIHEAGGLGEHIRDVTNRFANIGYVALGVDLYTREGGPPPPGDMQALFARLFSMSDATALGDLEGAADFLRARDDTTGKLGCVGFCMGGRYTLLFAVRERPPRRRRRLLGRVQRQSHARSSVSTPTRPTPPLTLADKLHCPLLAAIGAEDTNPSPEIGRAAARARRRERTGGESRRLRGRRPRLLRRLPPDATGPTPAAKLWQEIVPFLSRHLHAAG